MLQFNTMSPRTNKTASTQDEQRLLDRITRRYEQLDQQLEELEAKLTDLDIEQNDEAVQPGSLGDLATTTGQFLASDLSLEFAPSDLRSLKILVPTRLCSAHTTVCSA